MEPASEDAVLLALGYGDTLDVLVRESQLPAITQFLCHRLATRYGRILVPERFASDPVLTTRWIIRGAVAPMPFPDPSPPQGGRWPANQLTRGDLARLGRWSSLTGLPFNRLLHFAVHFMSESLRLHMIDLLDQQQQTQAPFEELLRGGPTTPADKPQARASPSRPHRTPAQTPADQVGGVAASGPAAPHEEPPDPLSASAQPPPSSDQIATAPVELDALAAEPPASSGRRQTRQPRKSAHADLQEREPDPPWADVLDQLRQARDEMRVLWEAVDELRETLEYTLRNPPEDDEPTRCRAAAELDLAADELIDRLDALPAEIIARLREHLAASAAGLPADLPSGTGPETPEPETARPAAVARPVGAGRAGAHNQGSPPADRNAQDDGTLVAPPSAPRAQRRLF